jgi:transposase
MGRSRGGLTTKIHAIVDANGLPIRLALSPGQAHDASLINELLDGLPPDAMLLGDRAYDADRIRADQAARGGWANIPPKSNRVTPIVFSPYLYRQRNLIERFFNRIKHFRRIATRYDKLADTFLAALKLVAVRIWLRHYESRT